MKKRLIPYLSVAIVSALCILTACDGQTLYHSYLHVPANGWEKHDTLVFHTDSIPQDATYQFQLELRSTDKFPYQSVWVIVEREFTPPQSLRRDTVECQLLDPVTQKTGRGIYLYQYSIPLPPLHLHKGQNGEIRIRHYMRRESLPGLHDIGIRMSR